MTEWKKPYVQPRLTAFDYERLGYSAMEDGLYGTAIGMFERAIEKAGPDSYHIESFQRQIDRAKSKMPERFVDGIEITDETPRLRM